MIKASDRLQDLRRRIYVKAKGDSAHRFWGLYVHVYKLETLQEAYRLAKRNNGSPGIDGVSFADIEEQGVGAYLKSIQDELQEQTYRPSRVRQHHIPKSNGKMRKLSIPTIRDRVVQGALKLILEPIFESNFQEGSYGYRPKRRAEDAIGRVRKAIVTGNTRVIDIDLEQYFDNVSHHIVLEKVALRVRDNEVMNLLKQILKSTGKKGVPQGGVISPLLSNIYLNEIDKMLEKAKAVTRSNGYDNMSYARYADDLIVLVSGHPASNWLVKALIKRLKEEFDKIKVKVNESKSKIIDLKKDQSFGFLGFLFQRRKSRQGNWSAYFAPLMEKRKSLCTKLKDIFKRYRSQPISKIVKLINPILRGWLNYYRIGHSGRCFKFVRRLVEVSIRRHMMRNTQRRGCGWKRWSSEELQARYKFYCDYRIRYWQEA